MSVEKRTKESLKLKQQISQAKLNLKQAQENSVLKKELMAEEEAKIRTENEKIKVLNQVRLKAHLNEKSANLGLDFEMETEKSSKLSNELDENEKLMDDTQKTLRDRFKTLEDKYERLRILQTDYNSMFTKGVHKASRISSQKNRVTLMKVNNFGEKWAKIEPHLNLAHSKLLNFKSENDRILIKLDVIMKAIETHINIANENHIFLPE